MNKFFKAMPGALFLIPVILTSCNKGAGQAGAPLVKDYAILTLSRQKTEMNIDYPATLEGQQTVEIRPRVQGIIEQIFVDEGAIVKKGQPLFRLDQDKYLQSVRSLQANVQAAQADVNAAQMEVNKIRPLVEKDIISNYALQSAQFTLQSREAALAQANANLENVKTDLSYTIIRSPANGVIGTIPYKIGALVSSTVTEPLTTVANTSDVYAYFSLNEKQLMDLTGNFAGMSGKGAKSPDVFLILPDGAQYSLSGKIETASGLINTETGSARLRATFANPKGLLRSGGTGSIRIPLKIDTAILIPQKSTYEIQGKRYVYMLADSDKVQAVEVKVNPLSTGQSFVVLQGLKPGDKIVLEGVGSLTEGTKIKPRPVNADSVFNSVPHL